MLGRSSGSDDIASVPFRIHGSTRCTSERTAKERGNTRRTGRGHGERIFEDAFSRKAQRTGALPEYLREFAIYNRPLFLLPVSPVFNENNKTIVCPLPHPLPLESRSFLSPFHLAHTFFLPSLPSEKNWYYILSSLDFL